jgi:soluble lytic murein transglycosylase-like protein
MKETMPIYRRLIAFAAAVLACSPLAAEDDARLPSPAFPAAYQAWRDGNPAEALAALDRELAAFREGEAPAAGLAMRAALLAEIGKPVESERAWLMAAEADQSLRAHALRFVVESRMRRGLVEEAAGLLDELISLDGSRDNLDLIIESADRYLDSGESSKAAALYNKVLRIRRWGVFADRARLGLADCEVISGDIKGAISRLRDAQLHFSSSECFAVAREREARHAKAIGETPKYYSQDQYHELVRRLRAASRFDHALALLEEWRTAHPEGGRLERIELETIDTLYRQRANSLALERCRLFYQAYPKSELLDDVRYNELRLQVRLGATARIKELAEDLRKAGTTYSMRHNTGIVLASYLVGIGDVEGGLDVYHQLYRAAASADAKSEILWKAGVAALRAEQNSRAAANLRALVRLNPGGDLGMAAWYWLAVAEQRLGNREEALAAALRLVERYPYHYYGVRANLMLPSLQQGIPRVKIDSLRRSARPAELKFPEPNLSGSAKRQAGFRCATILAQAGLLKDAAEALRKLLSRTPSDRALALCTVRALSDAGEHRAALDLIASLFPSFLLRPASGLPSDFWALAYPRPFWDEVRSAAAAQGVDPVLMLALMRQESRFDSAAVSSVGAIGLFQIMPYTADQIGPQVGLGQLDEEGIKEPRVNALLAARLLAFLMREFDGFYVPAIAAYNAGEDRVGAWWLSGKSLPDDLFIDSIPYQQTRQFVRQVLTNYFTYNRLYLVTTAGDGG